jgi:hypothetical protein
MAASSSSRRRAMRPYNVVGAAGALLLLTIPHRF